MRVLICDHCGKLGEMTPDSEIKQIELRNLSTPSQPMRRELCNACLDKFTDFFLKEEKKPTEKAPVAPDPKPATTADDYSSVKFIIKPEPDPKRPEPDPVQPEPVVIKKSEPVKPYKGEQAPEPQPHFQKTIFCANCKKPFVPKTKKSTTCSKHCSQYAWIDKQKKLKQDQLITDLKQKYPVKELPRKNVYHEM